MSTGAGVLGPQRSETRLKEGTGDRGPMTEHEGALPSEGPVGDRVRIVPTAPYTLQGSLRVVSFPTSGLAGTIAIQYLIRSLGIPQVA